MKRRRPDEESFEYGETASGVSKAEVRRMVSQEVRAAVEKTDNMIKALMERIQEIDSEPQYDARLRKLGAHVKKIKRRGDTAFAFITKELHQKKLSPNSLPCISDTRSLSSANGGCSDNGTSTSAEIDSEEGGAARKPKEGFWQRLRSEKEIVDLTDEDEEAVCRMNGENHCDSPPPPMLIREDVTAKEPSKPSYPVLKEQKKSPVEEAQQATLQFRIPRFPEMPFPNQLPAAAATKNMPQKLVVKVARIENPRLIALLWNVEEEDPHAADVDSYYIYVIQEFQGGTFSKWRSVKEIKAMPLPMACRILDRPEVKALHFIIVGKDVYGRFGPHSDVQTVTCS